MSDILFEDLKKNKCAIVDDNQFCVRFKDIITVKAEEEDDMCGMHEIKLNVKGVKHDVFLKYHKSSDAKFIANFLKYLMVEGRI